LGRGDMLYLPPDVAHDGVALDPCTTYSVGFRAPAAHELATAFLDWLRDRIELIGRYRDPNLDVQRTPARIGRDLQAYAKDSLSRVTWNERAIERFLGCYLTEPKPGVTFSPPSPALSRTAFALCAARKGLRLDSAAQLLYDARHIFVNGDALEPPRQAASALRRLADARELPPSRVDREALTILYRWYRDGFVHTG
ncbi:MAG TPA: winged helix domain-containing protein, partial [Casimicrobiaceae bacterium]|nr:winged helix domain-containing protein [Casimicrobiaceae bacterium]